MDVFFWIELIWWLVALFGLPVITSLEGEGKYDSMVAASNIFGAVILNFLFLLGLSWIFNDLAIYVWPAINWVLLILIIIYKVLGNNA